MRMEDDGGFVKRWRRDQFTLWLFQTGRRKSTGQEILRYVFKDGRKTIFKGSDFGCSPLFSIDSLDCVYSILSFLALKKGDTDADYFKDYTPEQLAWSESSRCAILGIRVSEHELRRDRMRRKVG